MQLRRTLATLLEADYNDLHDVQANLLSAQFTVLSLSPYLLSSLSPAVEYGVVVVVVLVVTESLS